MYNNNNKFCFVSMQRWFFWDGFHFFFQLWSLSKVVTGRDDFSFGFSCIFWEFDFFLNEYTYILGVCIEKKIMLASSGVWQSEYNFFYFQTLDKKKTNSKSCSKIIQFGTCKQFSDDIDLIDNLQKHSLAL